MKIEDAYREYAEATKRSVQELLDEDKRKAIIDMTKSKAKGTRAERELKNKFEDDGCYVMRSAGSHGEFDLAVFYPDRIRLIQVKTLGASVNKEELKAVEVPDCCTKEIWFKVPRRGFYGEVLE